METMTPEQINELQDIKKNLKHFGRKVKVIVATCAKTNLMGYNGNRKPTMPWPSCGEDFAYFKETTMGNAIIMGRTTLVSLPGILPGRPHVVLSRDPYATSVIKLFDHPNVYPAQSLYDAIDIASRFSSENGDIYIIGGAQIIQQALDADIVDEILLTKIYTQIEPGDDPVYFPELSVDD